MKNVKFGIKSLPSHLRPREKLAEKGPEALADFELLAILLRTGYAGHDVISVSKDILKKYPLKKLYDLSPNEIIAIKGIGLSRGSTISAAIELAKRIFSIEASVSITKPEDVVNLVSEIRNKKREHMIALYLDARNRLIKKHTISIGLLNASLIHPRETFMEAIACNAASVILAHNHPSGSVEPSEEDVAVTKRLIEAGKILGIEISDHIIVSGFGYVSMKERGEI
ncbi:MAG: RadC family protein [Candidatus Roizmanbacteria bacterium]